MPNSLTSVYILIKSCYPCYGNQLSQNCYPSFILPCTIHVFFSYFLSLSFTLFNMLVFSLFCLRSLLPRASEAYLSIQKRGRLREWEQEGKERGEDALCVCCFFVCAHSLSLRSACMCSSSDAACAQMNRTLHTHTDTRERERDRRDEWEHHRNKEGDDITHTAHMHTTRSLFLLYFLFSLYTRHRILA